MILRRACDKCRRRVSRQIVMLGLRLRIRRGWIGDVVDRRAAGLTRRALLRAGAGLALGAVAGGSLDMASVARAAALRTPGSVPDPTRAIGDPTDALPFDHIVILMQENHSFDSYFGMLPLRGQPKADGFTFSASGVPINSNPFKGGYVLVQHAPSDCRPAGAGSQSWNTTHHQVNDGRMDGFAKSGVDSMVYWDQPDLPFYYSLATTFCLARSCCPGITAASDRPAGSRPAARGLMQCVRSRTGPA